MKTKLFLTVLLSLNFCLLSSQVPQGINYQALAGDASGNPIRNTELQVKISLLSDTTLPATIWEELHPMVKTNAHGIFSLVVGKGTRQPASSVPKFSDISWKTSQLYIRTSMYYQSAWKTMGSAKLWSVPYSLVADNLSGAVGKLSVAGTTSAMDEALFEVKNKNGQTVFAVYNEGVRVYVDDGAKSPKGGFAIGGFDIEKGNPVNYFIISPDSARIYINNASSSKTPKGGFAIGGFDNVKGTATRDLLTVSDDSIRMYIDNNTKSPKGGFAIGGFDNVKGTNKHFLDVSTDATGVVNPSQNRILWYPIKNAFLAGKVLIEKPDSVGENSMAIGYESKARGQFSQALGYKAIARGDYATAIGKKAEAKRNNSFALGDNSRALNEDSYAFGAFSEARGVGSFAFGYVGRDSLGPTGKNTIASGNYSFAFGLGSQASGESAFAFGADNAATNNFSMAFGVSTKSIGWNSTTFGYNTQASAFVAMAIGTETVALGHHSFAGGDGSKASSFSAFAFGHNNLANGANSVSMGQSTKATGENSFAMGQFSEAIGKNSTAVGWNTLAEGIGSMAGGGGSKSTSFNTFAYGYNTLASGSQSVAMGENTKAIGDASFAMCDYTTANMPFSVAFGTHTISNGYASLTCGERTKTTAENSFAMGKYSEANGKISTALGFGIKVNSFAALAIGRYNDTTSMTSSGWYLASDPAFVIGNGTSNTDRKNAFTVLQNSNVGINMTNPQYKLDIVGGSARVESGFSWLTSSDIRYKKNISTLESSLEKVMNMRGVRFDMIADEASDEISGKNIGFIAQELESVIPEVVVTAADGYKSVAYDKVTAVLTEAIKEQQKQIESVRQENKDLKSELEVLKTLVNNLLAKQND